MNTQKKGTKNVTREQSLTAACVLRSKNLILLSAARKCSENALALYNHSCTELPSRNTQTDFQQVVDVQKDTFKRNIAVYLKEIFMLNGRSDSAERIGDKYHLGFSDLKAGFLAFHKENADKEITEFGLILNTQSPLKMGKIYPAHAIMPHLKVLQDDSIKGIAYYIFAQKILKDDEEYN